jgi:hypothetical protein
LTTSTSPPAITRSRSTVSESFSSTRLIDAEFSSRASLLTGASSLAVVVLRASASCAASSEVKNEEISANSGSALTRAPTALRYA